VACRQGVSALCGRERQGRYGTPSFHAFSATQERHGRQRCSSSPTLLPPLFCLMLLAGILAAVAATPAYICLLSRRGGLLEENGVSGWEPSTWGDSAVWEFLPLLPLHHTFFLPALYVLLPSLLVTTFYQPGYQALSLAFLLCSSCLLLLPSPCCMPCFLLYLLPHHAYPPTFLFHKCLSPTWEMGDHAVPVLAAGWSGDMGVLAVLLPWCLTPSVLPTFATFCDMPSPIYYWL